MVVFATTLAYVGATLGVLMVVPQVLRTVRHPRLGGVSTVSWGLLAVACLSWLLYGLRTQTWPQVPGNVFLVSGAVAVVLLVPSPHSRVRRAATLAAVAAAVVVVALAIPAHLVGYLAVGIGLTSAWPQLYDSLLSSRRTALSGVSIATWGTRLASQSCWLAYAVLVRDVPVLLSASVALSAATAMVAVEASRRFAWSGGLVDDRA